MQTNQNFLFKMEITKEKKRLGIDVGGVIFRRDPFDRKCKTSKRKSKTQTKGKFGEFEKEGINLIEGALEGLEHLSQSYELFIVSYCKVKMETMSRAKLQLAGVTQWIPEENWIFVRDRASKVTALEDHGLFGLIDDRVDVLETLVRSPKQLKRFWFAGDDIKAGHTIVKDWKDVCNKL